ncbi:DUF2585 domain-containing protein [Sphingomonas sp. MJ1 (PH-R8)]|uniref:DUF2585 domain-containing protein n=1 Tax=Sphingomonas sp. MJ1 (PH-R8) TaxID=3112950 RepID=UPI003A8A0600
MATTFPTRTPSHSARWWWATLAIVSLAALVLLAMGRTPICTCGTVKLWHGTVQSAENSQHLADWYSLSHVVHGLIFYGLGWLVLRRQPWQLRLAFATLVEAAWEILENSPIIIDRYRAVTIALGYEGDSVVNSVADIGWMVVGFAVARRLPPWATIALGIALELVALAAIRDNLTLNVWMLLTPNDAVRSWQAGA